MGQILLHYAAFCAARTGAVYGADIDAMTLSAKRILLLAPGAALPGGTTHRIEALFPASTPKNGKPAEENNPRIQNLLQVKIDWDYPLIVPFAAQLLKRKSLLDSTLNHPSFPLTTSWNITLEADREDSNGKRGNRASRQK